MPLFRSPSCLLFALISLLAHWQLASAAPSKKSVDLSTTAERENWLRTGRYAEVEELCRAFPQKFPGRVRCERFGTSPEGRPLLALIAGAPGYLEPVRAAKAGRPSALFQGGIHAGEIDGKDAGFVFLREVLSGDRLPGVLNKLNLIFVPVFNVDGHERFGPNHRPNQIGPEAMGWRTTAQNYNLNRDYLKADAPEMRAMLGLLNLWDPLLYIDLHVTDGAKFEHDIAIIIESVREGGPVLGAAAKSLEEHTMLKLKAAGHLPLWFYPSFDRDDEPSSGISIRPQPPRFSNGYWALRNRLGVLVETHSWRDYKHRCQATLAALDALIAGLADQAASWQKAAREADAAATRLAGQPVTLRYKNTEKIENFAFRGYAYTRRPSEISGQPMTVYDTAKPEIWNMPLRQGLEAELTRAAPRGGYLIPPAYKEMLEPLLRAHGLEFSALDKPESAKVEVFSISEVELGAKSYEKRQRASYKGSWEAREETLPQGSLWVPIEQKGARLMMQLFEPESGDSLLAWGFFNEIFERKEYMEAYVAETVAREMLKDPKIKKEFEERLASDPDFAKSPEQRLDFFYRKHPSFDARLNRYPIVRSDHLR